MQFVYPGFLWALTLIGIPIFIHLFNFRRYKKVEFSNVAMLKEIETQSRKSRQLKKWLILLARVLAIVALVLAFAQPYIPLTKDLKGRSLQTIYIDNSFSLNASGEGGPLFEQAKNAARTLLANLPAEQEILMLSNESASSQHILSQQRAEKWVDELSIQPFINDFNQILRSAQRICNSEGYAQVKVFVISDLQNTTALNESLDSLNNLSIVRLRPLGVRNISIDSAWLASPINNTDEPINLKVSLSNHGKQKIENVNLVLNINGIQQGAQALSIDGNSKNTIDVSFKSSNSGWLSGELKITDPLVSYDNSYYFSLELKKTFKVLVLSENKSHFASVFASDPQFDLHQFRPLEVDYASLSSYDMIVLNQLADFSPALSSQVNQFLENGGVVYYVPSDKPLQNISVLPLAKQGQKKMVGLGIQLQDLNHPFFKGVYNRIPQNSLMPKVSSLYSLSIQPENEVLLSLKDGSPVFVRTKKSKGMLYQLAFPLDLEWSNFYEHELFVLSCLKSAFSKQSQREIAYLLNYDGPISVSTNLSEKALSLSIDLEEIIVESASALGQFRFWLNSEIKRSGIYKLSHQNSSDTLSLIAINYNRLESIQDYYQNEDLLEAFKGQIKFYDNQPEMLQSLASSSSSAKPLWKMFVVFCLIFLLIEILLLRFLKS